MSDTSVDSRGKVENRWYIKGHRRSGQPCQGYHKNCLFRALWCYDGTLYFCNSCYDAWTEDNDFDTDLVVRLSDNERMFDRAWKIKPHEVTA